MAPFIVWGVFAIIGFIYNGFIGFVLGVFLGFIFLCILGTVLNKMTGGVLFRFQRDIITSKVHAGSQDILNKLYPNRSPFEQKLIIDEYVEEIAREAIYIHGTFFDQNSLEHYTSAIESIISKSSADLNKKYILISIQLSLEDLSKAS